MPALILKLKCKQATGKTCLIITEKDWEETLRSFGPKFTRLADMVSGSDDSSLQEEGGGSEV